ncbi:hypothetical protein [Pelotalea chapellei]|uniref:Outer membrane lipoprotein BamD-like domain-containing protein n=1 Tax=Pelotalea chapellei TaxID=44671 RepID=A0ABS5U9R1_9BACT|nr:hypothetical protein [Pelotalea chapellei]MBT1072361.1 hypothetical protein [Pelotalea chapellei]
MKLSLVSLFILCLLAVGCSSDKKATELLDTARFEEKQNNREHATKLYEEIINKYPSSSAAATAKARLSELKH